MSEITKNFLKNTKIILFSQKYKNIHLYVFQIYDLRNSLYLELKSVVQNARSVSLTVQPRDPTPFQYDAKNIYIFIFLLVKYNKTHCLVDMVVAARALAELRLVSVFARIPPTHPPPPTHINLT